MRYGVTVFLAGLVVITTQAGFLEAGHQGKRPQDLERDLQNVLQAGAPPLVTASASDATDDAANKAEPSAKKPKMMAADDETVPQAKAQLDTPKRLTAPENQLTPGQMLSKKRAQLLKRENLVRIVGEETVTELDVDWPLIEDPNTSPDHPGARVTLFRLLKGLTSLTIELRRSPDPTVDLSALDEFQASLALLKTHLSGVHYERLQQQAGTFFTWDRFKDCHYQIKHKTGGVQMGLRALVTFPGTQTPITYYVKTHSRGLASERSSAAKRVNPQELVVYKLLEALGFGCEVHFFERSPQDVYIATRDANIIDDAHATTPPALGVQNFFLFQALENDEALGVPFWGTLNENATTYRKDAVEEAIKDDPVALAILDQMAALDLLSRLLGLSDLLNNSENFGFVRKDDTCFMARVIDFRISKQTVLRLTKDHFGGFLEGNGLFNYAAAHRTIRYALRDRVESLRVATALRMLEGPLQNLAAEAGRAAEAVKTYFTKDDTFEDCLEPLLSELETYKDNIQHNFQLFYENMKAYGTT